MPDSVPGPMGVSFPTSMPSPGSGLLEGIQQGVTMGNHFAQIGLMAAQKRTAEYELAANKAKLGMQLMGDPDQATKVRMNAANNLVAPFMNDPRWGFNKPADDGTPAPPVSFTEEDLQKPGLQKAVDASESILKNPDYPPAVKLGMISANWGEYFASRSQDTAAADLLGKAVVMPKYTPQTSPTTGKPFLAGDIPGMPSVPIPDPTQPAVPPSPTPGKPTRVAGDKNIYTPDDFNNPALVNPVEKKTWTENVIKPAQEAIAKDPTITEYQSQLANFPKIRQMIASGNPAATGVLRAQITKQLAGLVGKLSDFEVKQNGGDPSLLAKAKRNISLAVDGKLPASDLADFTQMLDVAQKNAVSGIETRSNALLSNYQKRLPAKFSPALLKQMVVPGAASAPAQPSAGAAPVGQGANAWAAFANGK